MCLFCFSGKLDCLFCIFAWWIIVFWRFWWGFFFLLLSLFPAGFSNLMEVYRRFIVTKIPKWFLSYFFSARNFLFLECYAALWRFFFLPAQCTWKCFFFFFSGTSENGSTVFKTGNDIYDFSSDEQQCRFKERFRIHLVAQFIVFSFLSFHVCVIFVFFVVKGWNAWDFWFVFFLFFTFPLF